MKAVILLKASPGTSREAFAQWWIERHRPMAERLPGLVRHAFNLAEAGAPFDAVIEQWFEDEAAARNAYAGEIGRAVAADSLAMVAERVRFLVQEHAFAPGAAP